MTKAFNIPKSQVWKAYKLVRANAGSAGIDQQSLKDFEIDVGNNLYKIWNRLSSGSYFPPSVKAAEIPKKSGGVRILGIPTVSDRIAQMVVKLSFEPKVEPYFLDDSYGYRANKSALDAIEITRKRCWKYDWVLEFDIKGLFDNIPHDLLMKAVKKHTQDKMIILYIQRWLTASIVMPNGETISRSKGTPQGGVISPILANLFLHYAFDKWVQREYPNNAWCRYADDGLIHCTDESH
ncbi:group II intron reverse transcriptase/maturase [Brucella sp. 10RB9214]|uniref:group II intron reverse transcriptase/maturase n=1 Tax=Brucella sp. 10RB9214 TaxID=1844040 RepID=UPI001FFEF110|nr:group II intron reverse transcriptase/maturase [Brucella sp. 10RB9214]